MPNKRRLDLLLAEHMRGLAEGSVRVHPPVQVLSQWIASLLRQIFWLNGTPMPRIVDAQLLALAWQNAWPNPDGSLSSTEKSLAARQAMAADRLIRQWYSSAEETWLDRNFFLARQGVETFKRESVYCTADELLAGLCERLESPAELPVSLPQELVFHGFQEWTLLESRLLDALQHRDVKLQRNSPPGKARSSTRTNSNSGSVSAIAFATVEEEWRSAAIWARQKSSLESQDPGQAPVAVVIEGLNQCSSEVRRIFEQVFTGTESESNASDSNGADSNAASPQPDFHLPYGPPLLEHAAIQDALMLLRLAMQGTRTPVPFATLSRCLLSPHWGAADSERIARAQLELKLRKDGAWRASLASLFEKARNSAPEFGPEPGPEPGPKPGLESGLETSLKALREATAVDWSAPEALEQALCLLQWPGPLAVGTSWASLVARFSSLLERAQNLDGMTPAERLLALQQMCLAQEQDGIGGPLSPVQLLTPEDAVGEKFTAAWVAGLNAGRWPGQPLSNPFLPASVAQHIPRASASGELAWCEDITRGLKNLAPEVIFSWASQVDEVQQSPSPLIADLPLITLDTLPVTIEAQTSAAGEWNGYAQHPWLEEIADGQGLALAEDEPIRGGAATISDQSASPLAAYLKHRLNACFEPMPEAFADAAWRGSLLHRALHALYQPALQQRKLPTVAEIPPAVEIALQSMRAFNRLSPIHYRAEQQRLERLLQTWLEFDLQRPAFQVIALEHELNTELLAHPIRLKVDRVDQVDAEEGSPGLVIIDYKSSPGSLSAWARDRLGEAQLPLYATVWRSETPVAGLALAAVSYGKIALNGVVADQRMQYDKMKAFRQKSAAGVHKRFADWPEALGHWRGSILAIAGEFIAGDARNTVYDPNQYTVSELAPLLRLEEGAEWQRQRGTAP